MKLKLFKDVAKKLKLNMAKKKAEEAKAAEKPKEAEVQGELQGKMVRIVAEELGAYACGEIAEVLSHVGDSLLVRCQRNLFSKIGKNIRCKVGQVELTGDLLPAKSAKKMMLTNKEKIELDSKFQASELKGPGSLQGDTRLAATHMEMGIWLIARDLEPGPEIQTISPEYLADVMRELEAQTDSSAEAFCRAAADLKVKLEVAKLILCPAWGSAGPGSEHWTLLTLEKMKKGWQVRYRDSLAQECQHSRRSAEKILSLLSMVLGDGGLQVPSRCNASRQAKGSGACGHFVLHWIDLEIRKFQGEGHSAGYPNPSKWLGRLQLLSQIIVRTEGIRVRRAKQAAQQKLAEEARKEKAVELAKKIMESKDFLDQAAEFAKASSCSSYGPTGGCPQCRFASFGSTCCNPLKIAARGEAEEDYRQLKGWEKPVAGQFDRAVYKTKLEALMAKMAKEKGMPMPALPSFETPGGGGEVPTQATQFFFL